jgi:hypothetical protein
MSRCPGEPAIGTCSSDDAAPAGSTIDEAVLAYLDRAETVDLQVIVGRVSAARWSHASTDLDMSIRRWVVAP